MAIASLAGKTAANGSVFDVEIDFADQVNVDQGEEHPVGVLDDANDTEHLGVRSRVDQQKHQ